MREIGKAPAFLAAVELLGSCERRIEAFADDALAIDIRANCVILVSQSVLVALLDDVPARRAALDEMRRIAKRLSILIDVAHTRGLVDGVSASRLRVRLGTALHAARPRKPQAQAGPRAVTDEDITIPEVRRGSTRHM
jgi:hypothetical protein